VLVGSDRRLDREGVDLSAAAAASPGQSHVYVAVDGSLRGVLAYAEAQ
jgi:cation transport ATPase